LVFSASEWNRFERLGLRPPVRCQALFLPLTNLFHRISRSLRGIPPVIIPEMHSPLGNYLAFISPIPNTPIVQRYDCFLCFFVRRFISILIPSVTPLDESLNRRNNGSMNEYSTRLLVKDLTVTWTDIPLPFRFRSLALIPLMWRPNFHFSCFMEGCRSIYTPKGELVSLGTSIDFCMVVDTDSQILLDDLLVTSLDKGIIRYMVKSATPPHSGAVLEEPQFWPHQQRKAYHQWTFIDEPRPSGTEELSLYTRPTRLSLSLPNVEPGLCSRAHAPGVNSSGTIGTFNYDPDIEDSSPAATVA
jgi:hypothetical protein